jgi:LacI family transcriptional regulator
MTKRKSLTLADLATDLGLTVQTVSKALRGLPGMSEETRSRIVRTAYESGYLTVDQARELTSRGIQPYASFRRRFVLIQSRQAMNYNRLLVQGIQERFAQFEHRLETCVLDEELTDVHFAEWMTAHNLLMADGLFIAPRLVSSRMEQKLLALPLPRVLVNYPRPGSRVDSVVWDVYEAICQSVERLILAGHSRILYVGDTQSQRGFVHRWQAFLEMMTEYGLVESVASDVADYAGRMNSPGGSGVWSARVEDFLDCYRRCKPTAVLVVIDEEAQTVYEVLRSEGVRIPDDCSYIALLNEQPPC